jgi:hypothetical protein
MRTDDRGNTGRLWRCPECKAGIYIRIWPPGFDPAAVALAAATKQD